MKIISFDVGIKNMAYCIFLLNTSGHPFEIVDWNVISLMEKEESHIYCNCASVKTKQPKKSQKKIQNFFLKDSKNIQQQNETIENTISIPPICPPKLCCRIGKFKKGQSIYCDKHANAQSEWLIPDARFSQKKIKKTKIDDLIKLATELNIENIAKKRADIITQIDAFILRRCLEPVIKQEKKNAGEADLVSIGKKMREVFDDVLKNHTDITHVIIENQISPLANRMKTIQGMLSQYFIMVYDTISIEFISSANKLKMFSQKHTTKEETQTKKQIEQIQNTQEIEQTQSQKYKGHKKDGVFFSHKVLENNKWVSNKKWDSIFESKKKDDLADCFLQGIWYLIKNEKIVMNENYILLRRT
jgi:hypothetical protein